MEQFIKRLFTLKSPWHAKLGGRGVFLAVIQQTQSPCSLGEKMIGKTSIQVGMDPERVRKEDRYERTQDYPTSAKKYTADVAEQMSGSLPAFFHLCLVSVLLQVHPYVKMKGGF